MQKTWEELEKYQPSVLKVLGNSITRNRVAHAYLLEGSRGTGKKAVSYLFAKSLFCLNPTLYKPCLSCNNCKRIESGNHPDVHFLEPDGLSIKKGQVQQLQEEFSKTGVESRKKLYIINHADKMTVNAANSLLKFLEEPNSDTVALLLTEQIHRILNTILSRCQVLSFQPLQPRVISDQLKEQGVPPHLSSLVSNLTSNLDEAVSLANDEWFGQSRLIVLQLYEVLTTKPVSALFHIQDSWLPHFKEREQMDLGLNLLLLIYKDLLYIQIGEEERIVYDDQVVKLKSHALQSTTRRVTNQITAILDAKHRLSTNMNPHLLMEQLVFNLQEGLKFV